MKTLKHLGWMVCAVLTAACASTPKASPDTVASPKDTRTTHNDADTGAANPETKMLGTGPLSAVLEGDPEPTPAYGMLTADVAQGPGCEGDAQRVINTKRDTLIYCFEKELQVDRDLEGQVAMKWQLDAQRKATNVVMSSTTLENALVEGCIQRVISKARFAAQTQTCIINATFDFAPVPQ